MAKESCANCLFLGKDNYMRKDEDVCRRFPPARVDNHNTRYPAIDMDDWCGEWKPNQELQDKHEEAMWESIGKMEWRVP